MNIKPVSNDRDTEKLRKLYDTCETNYRGLKALGVNETAYSTIVVPEILEKLPETFRLTITRDKDYSEWTMTEVMNAFLKEIELREAHKPRTEKPDSHERRKNNIHGHGGASAAALFTRQDLGKGIDGRIKCAYCLGEHSHEDLGKGIDGRIKCAYCLGEHSHEECRKITEVNERKQLICKYGRCFICLKKGHISKNCSSDVNCSACGKRYGP